jgi:hypothetical protein
MKVQPRIIDQHDKIPGLCLQHPPDGSHALDQAGMADSPINPSRPLRDGARLTRGACQPPIPTSWAVGSSS